MIFSTKLYPQNFSQASGSVWDPKVTSGAIPVSLFPSAACDKSLTPDKISLSSTPGYLKCLQTLAGGSTPFECVCVSGPVLGTVTLLSSANPHSLLRGSTCEGSAHPPHPFPQGWVSEVYGHHVILLLLVIGDWLLVASSQAWPIAFSAQRIWIEAQRYLVSNCSHLEDCGAAILTMCSETQRVPTWRLARRKGGREGERQRK